MFALEAPHEATGCRLVIQDDGRVAYAYLLDPEGTIVGDVWLYNRAPPGPEIDFRGQAPLLNPHTHQRRLVKPVAAGDFSVFWSMTEDSLLVDIHLHGSALARLSPGSQPGGHVHALESPLARPWVESEAPNEGEASE